ncbi:MAG: hypothetical protein NTX03_05340 [Bacteroidetes bacterium]|nr:hypothetical protein [Bacteroidota bacterium]
MKNSLYIFLSYFLLAVSCKHKSGKTAETVTPIISKMGDSTYFSEDFENRIDGNLFKEFAHSGKVCCMTDKGSEYSLGFEFQAAKLTRDSMEYAWASCWVYAFDKKAEAQLVIDIEDTAGKNISWLTKNIMLGDLVEKQWTKVSMGVRYPAVKHDSKNKVKVFFWNKSKTKILMDDLVASFDEEKREFTSTGVPNKNFFVHYFYKDESQDLKELQNLAAENGKIWMGNFSGKGDDFVSIQKGKMSLLSFDNNVWKNFASLFEKELMDKSAMGDFDNDKKDELLLMDFEAKTINRFHFKGAFNSVKSVLKIPNLDNKTNDFVVADFDGKPGDEVLLYGRQSNWWQALKFVNGDWKIIAENPDGIQKKSANATRMVAGRFSGTTPTDEIVNIEYDAATGKSVGYSILLLNVAKNGFDIKASVYKDAFKNDRLFGTLNIDDEYFVTPNWNDKSLATMVCLNRNGRFRLDYFSIIENQLKYRGRFDFAGYTADQNPKYYEQLRIAFPTKNCKTGRLITLKSNCLDENFSGQDCSKYDTDKSFPPATEFYFISK